MNQLDRNAETFEDRGTILQFFEFLAEKELLLCQAMEPSDPGYVGHGFGRHVPTNLVLDTLLDEYFGIDPIELEKERLIILQAHRLEQGMTREGVL